MIPHKQPWMDLPINAAEPLTMHVDMNSCFATMEQQANPLLRGRPVGVAAYNAPYGCVIAPSYEAKAKGVKTGMRVWEARQLCPDIAIIQSNPPLYRDAHMRFKRIFQDYSDRVVPKSIDEAVIDFGGTEQIRKGKSLVDIGYEIKKRVRDEIGDWVRVNVGISTNRFLAKTAAGLHKPDGLDVITKDNLLDIYAGMDLLDITGINTRYQARLMQGGIRTPLEFFNAPIYVLKKEVFKSIVGYYWYVKLRGWEIEDYESPRQTIGHNYTVQVRPATPEQIEKFMMKLCEKTGRRLRRNSYFAEGIQVWASFQDHTFWHVGHRVGTRLYTTSDIFHYAMNYFNERPHYRVITKMGVTVYDLQPLMPEQVSLFDGLHGDKNALSRSLDAVNNRYGDMVVGSALLMDMDNFILDRVAFGSVKDLQELYSDS